MNNVKGDIDGFFKAIDLQLKPILDKEERDTERRKEREMKGVDLSKCQDCGVPINDKERYSVASCEGVFYICKKCNYSQM